MSKINYGKCRSIGAAHFLNFGKNFEKNELLTQEDVTIPAVWNRSFRIVKHPFHFMWCSSAEKCTTYL